MQLTDIASLCRHVSHFQRKENWHLKGLAVICWEFSTLTDFFHAKSDLERMIHSELFYGQHPGSAPVRPISPDTIELDCYGVTFRLTCLERLATQHGSVGVGDGAMTNYVVQKPNFRPPFHDQ